MRLPLRYFPRAQTFQSNFPSRLSRYSAQFWDRFSAVYELQTQGQAYDSPEDLLRAAGVYDDSQVTLFEAVEVRIGRCIGEDLLHFTLELPSI